MDRRTLRRPAAVLAALVLGIVAVMPAAALDELQPDRSAPVADDRFESEGTGYWFVQLKSRPTVQGTAPGQITKERAAFAADARANGVAYRERMAFGSLWNGLSVQASAADAARMSRLPSVGAVYPVVEVELPETSSASPDLATALVQTGADVAQSELGLDGAGVTVAVMDTGIDYDHPDLGGCFGPGCRVVAGWDFVGDDFNADASSPAYEPDAIPDDDPDDCNGHGTHVAGIVGASGDPEAGGARGVAPGVTFGAYRVFGCEGSTTADIMVAAMERALADGMDVLNMSIGSSFQWPQYPTALAADALVDAGMVVVASIGNSGANGLYAVGAPGIGAKVIGVASFDNSHVALNTFTISPDGTSIGYANAAAAPPAPTSGDLPMAKTAGATQVPNDGCAALPAGSMAGKAVLIQRGTCGFHVKALNAQNAGAAAVVLYNNVAGRFSPTVAGTPAITIPVVAISDTEGKLIHDRLVAGAVTLTWTDQTGTFPNATAGLISSFSSYGLPPDLSFKPDLGAPGGLIRSTYPVESGAYATISGTSMASPHVAGAVALYREARPGTSAAEIQSRFQNSADPAPWSLNAGLGFLDHTFRQGAGMLDIDDAVLSTTLVQPSEIAMGESTTGPQTRTLSLTNSASAAVTYDLSHVGTVGARVTNPPHGFLGPGSSASFSSASVTVPAGGSATVDVTITPPAGSNNSLYGGYVVLTPQGGGQVLRVPFAGFVGDYQSIQAVTSGGAGFPLLARITACGRFVENDCTMGGSYSVGEANPTYTLQDEMNNVFFLVHLEHQVRELRLEIIDPATGRNWGRGFTQDYVGRNSTASSFFAFAFDGTLTKGRNGRMLEVPDGTYVARLSALKALGDPANPAHWETWTSPTFAIDRP